MTTLNVYRNIYDPMNGAQTEIFDMYDDATFDFLRGNQSNGLNAGAYEQIFGLTVKRNGKDIAYYPQHSYARVAIVD